MTMAGAKISIRIDLPNGSRLGPGKIALLEAVRAKQSISAAARDLDMSYRRAWLLIDDLNRAFAEPVVATFPGRSQGPGAMLTPFGARLIDLYRALEAATTDAGALAVREIVAASNKGYAPGALTRRRPKADGEESGDPPA